nr:hypothetical protein [Tanacetum cinerariifolium]
MTSLADKAILSGAENRPPMLEKDMYDSWRSRMEMYMLNRQYDRIILELVEHGPLLWPSVTEEGVTRLKKYSKLSAAEAIQTDCDVKATYIILQALPLEIYALVSTHKVAKDLWEQIQMLMQGTSLTKQEKECKLYDAFDKFAYQKGEILPTNIILQGLPLEIYALVSTHKVAKDLWEQIQMLIQGTSLTKQEKECKLYDAFDKFAYQKGETLRDFYLRFPLLLNEMNMYNMKLEQFHVNTKFLNTLPPEWSKFVTDVKLTESSAEQAFWSQYSVQIDEPDLSVQIDEPILSGTTIVEVPKELFKVSMELFTSFDQWLIDEVTEVQNVFSQMELAIEQHCEEKSKVQTKMENVLQDNDRLLTQVLSVEIVNIVVHENMKSVCLNVTACGRCVTTETKLKTKFLNNECYDMLLQKYHTLEKHFITLEVNNQLNTKLFQRDTWSSQESAPTFTELFKINNLKAQAQEKDTVTLKLKEKLNSLNGYVKDRDVKRTVEEIKALNIELDHKKIIKGQVKNQVKEQVSSILPRIEESVNATLEAEVLTRSSQSSRTSYAIAVDLSEMELKKILIEKMEGNKSIQLSDEQRNLYKALVEAYDADKGPFAGSNRGSKRQKEGGEQASASTTSEKAIEGAGGSTTGSQSRQMSSSESAFAEEPVQTTCQLEETPHPVFETGVDDQPIVQTSQHPEWFSQPRRPPSPDHAWNTTLPAAQGDAQSWISNLARQTDAHSSFNDSLTLL